MHKLLQRQLRKFFRSADSVPDALKPFVAAVEEAYRQSDADRAVLEHSMETVSLELADRYERLRDALGARDESAQALSLLTATLEATADGVLVVDLHGKIVRTNARFAELWRIPESVLQTRDDDKALEFVLGQLEDPDGFLRKVRELYSQPEAESFDVLRFRDGRVFERYSMPQRVGGVTVGRVWSFRDVTRRRQLEDQLRQGHKMEAVGQLAGGIAHDFNNLLTVVRAHADFLEQTVSPASPQHQDVEEIIKAVNRAAGLTRQLLAFSRKQMLQSVVFDLNSVITSVEPMLRRLIGEDIEICTRCSSGPAVVSADPGQMEQVLVNLVINARDAMPRGGRLTIETADVKFGEGDRRPGDGATPPGRYVRLAVSDTGIGIPPDQIGHLFEPFYTTKELGKGTGLGLSTLYGIVKQSDGYIWVESEVEVGSTFSIYLPRAEGVHSALAEPVRVTPKLGGSETILVAEDEEAVGKLIVRILEREGYAVLTARHGRAALEVAARHRGRIDLLLTDVIMPELGGRELLERLRVKRPGIPVLYISGYTDSEIDRRGMLQEDAAFLQKPFTGGSLALAVRNALDQAAAGARRSRAAAHKRTRAKAGARKTKK